MFASRRSRMVGPLSPRDRRRVATATAGVLLDKALHLSTDVQSAMVSRGYRGEVRLIDDFHTTPIDWTGAGGLRRNRCGGAVVAGMTRPCLWRFL